MAAPRGFPPCHPAVSFRMQVSTTSSSSALMLRVRSVFHAAFAWATLATSLTAQRQGYHVVKRMVIGTARADYIIVDPVGRRLYGLGDKVIDVDRDTVIGSVAGGGGGYAIAADQNRGLARNGVIFDLKTLAVTGHVDANGDGIRYDPVTHRSFTWEGKDAWVVDMRTGTLVTKSTIGDGLESGVADGKGKLFLNVEDSGFIQRVDAQTLTIEATYKIPACGRAQGLSLDASSRRLFMACDTAMVVVNADDGSVVTRFHVPSRADQNCFDPGTKLAFNPNRVDSTMTIVHEDSPSAFAVVGTVPTGGGARTCALDEKTHKVYVFYYQGTTRENAQLVLAVLAP
jgi:DNA-binding beta-propeller fold protein YncE